jgi:predicted nuclease with TOPRIM domain
MDTIESMREEFELLQTELNRVKNENIELNQNARLTRLYRDEIDTLNDKLTKMEKHQQELERYKERFNEFDTFKNRVEELQNESKIFFFI